MSKYIQIYERLCRDDPIEADDPRRPAIIEEMISIHRAATEADAVAVVAWWQAWPNPQHQTANEFVREARELMRGETAGK